MKGISFNFNYLIRFGKVLNLTYVYAQALSPAGWIYLYIFLEYENYSYLGNILKHLIIILTLFSASLGMAKIGFNDLKRLDGECSKKNAQSCFHAGQVIPKEDIKLADKKLKYYLKGCDLDHEKSCISVGNHYLSEKKIDKSFKYYNKFCLKKSGLSCFIVGSYFYSKKDFKNALKSYQTACDLNFPQACRNLAVLEQKDGNRVKALSSFQRACYLGELSSCKNLGNIYQQVGDITKAKKFFNLAKNQKWFSFETHKVYTQQIHNYLAFHLDNHI